MELRTELVGLDNVFWTMARLFVVHVHQLTPFPAVKGRQPARLMPQNGH